MADDREGALVPTSARHTACLELRCILSRTCWLIAIGARLDSRRWDINKCFATLAIEVSLFVASTEPSFTPKSVIINTPNGPAPPLVTGTFGSADFLHSLMGEATDKLSQASVTDLSKKMDDVRIRAISRSTSRADPFPGVQCRPIVRVLNAKNHTR